MENGGKRKGAGRKSMPALEKKGLISLYVKNRIIANFGGDKELKKILLLYIKRKNMELNDNKLK